ncbi:MAG: mechanosensitive ion channel [Saprospiraceae bacterium]|nr:mechanosensitive ion channel [Saprospiraceae bacterium]
MQIRRLPFVLPLWILFWFFIPNINGQDADQGVDLTLESPYNTVLVHLYYLQPDSYQPDQSARTLAGVQDSARASRLAIQLKQIYDGEGLYVAVNTIPQDPNYIDSLREGNFFVPFPDQYPQIYLEKLNGRWYYSEETVTQIPIIHKAVYPLGADWLLNVLPSGGRVILGLYPWQYLGLLIVGLIMVILYFITRRLLIPLVYRISSSRLSPDVIPRSIIRQLAGYLSVWLVIRVLFWLLPPLQLPIAANVAVITILQIIGVILLVLVAYRIIDIIALNVRRVTSRTESKMDDQLVPLVRTALKAVVVVLAIFSMLRLLNFDPTALIAGISIGGLAVALAAQDTLKNLFGSFTIFLDKPFQVGDWINFGNINGTVEEVGFRSTRVRTFENSLVYVPNGSLGDTVINNYGLRVYRRFNTKLALTYDTPPALIEAYVEGLREMVRTHPKTRKDYFEIHLNELGADALQILFYIFFEVPSWTDELKAKHEILISAMELASALGVRFAFPTTTLHIEELPGQGTTTPAYDLNPQTIRQRLDDFQKGLQQKFNDHK